MYSVVLYTAYMVHEKDLERRPLRYAIIVMFDPSDATKTDERQHHTPKNDQKSIRHRPNFCFIDVRSS